MASILLAEDDTAMRGFLKAALEKNGHTVHAAQDGAEALSYLDKGGRYELLLTDIVMPNMDGLELSLHARKIAPTMPVMFITGFAGLAAEDNPANTQIISKPFNLKDIVDEVNKILANNRLQNDG